MDMFRKWHLFMIICGLLVERCATVRPCVPRKPTMIGTGYFFEHRKIVVNCTVPFIKDHSNSLELVTPHGSVEERVEPRIEIQTNELNLEKKMLYKSLTIEDAREEDAGTYVCINKCGSTKTSEMNVTFLTPDEAFVNLSRGRHESSIETGSSTVTLRLGLVAYPEVNVTVEKNNQTLLADGKKYGLRITDELVLFRIYSFTPFDTANYTIIAYNEYQSSKLVFEIKKKVKLTVDLGGIGDKIYQLNSVPNITCNVQGYPLPGVHWSFRPFCNESKCPSRDLKSTEEVQSIFEIKSFPEMKAETSGEITCTAYRPFDVVTHTRRFLVYEVENGFGIRNKMNHRFPANENITLTCLASKFAFANVTWSRDNFKDDASHKVISSENANSLISELKIWQASTDDAGDHGCIAYRNNGTIERDSVSVTITGDSPL